MAGIDILAKYGIKEVADVVFYELNKLGKPAFPVLYLDTLKVSTIEQTAESSDARGGKGNAALISWDYGKEINVTLEDALFSAKSMAIMFGNGKVNPYVGENAYIMKTESFIATAAVASVTNGTAPTGDFGWDKYFTAPDGKRYEKKNPKFYKADAAFKANSDTELDNPVSAIEKDERYFCTYDLKVNGAVIEVSADSFPGTYYVTGDTYARSEASGTDEFFQFIIPKAKVQSENTITLEAEGEPSVFNMSLKVLRPDNGKMMKLVKYELVDEIPNTESSGAYKDIDHNHILITNNMADLKASNSGEQVSG